MPRVPGDGNAHDTPSRAYATAMMAEAHRHYYNIVLDSAPLTRIDITIL